MENQRRELIAILRAELTRQSYTNTDTNVPDEIIYDDRLKLDLLADAILRWVDQGRM